MIGGFLYDEPAPGLEEIESNEGIRALCFLTRATKATAGYGEALATRFLSVDRARELYLRWRGRHRRVEVTYAWCSSSGDSSSGDSSGDDWGAAAAAELAAQRRNWWMRSGRGGPRLGHAAHAQEIHSNAGLEASRDHGKYSQFQTAEEENDAYETWRKHCQENPSAARSILSSIVCLAWHAPHTSGR